MILCHITLPHIFYDKYNAKALLRTPPKTNMEPENGPLEKQIPIGNHHFQVPCWISGVYVSQTFIPIILQYNSLWIRYTVYRSRHVASHATVPHFIRHSGLAPHWMQIATKANKHNTKRTCILGGSPSSSSMTLHRFNCCHMTACTKNFSSIDRRLQNSILWLSL